MAKNITTVVVDGHPLYLEGLIDLLKSQPDFTVVGRAGNVSDAIRTALEKRPRLILLDMDLPDGTGLDVMEKVLPDLPETNFVFLTAHESQEARSKAIRTGAKGYLTKNIPNSKLLLSLRAVMQGEFALPRRVISEFFNQALQELHEHELSQIHQFGLTPREVEVIEELCKGKQNYEIAQSLTLSENTVKVHIHHILKKLNLNNRREVVEFASKVGLF